YLIELMVLAKMVHAAAIGPDAAVLDIGAATGYSSAVLARIAASVVALEEDEALAGAARQALAGSGNVTVVTGALAGGAPQQGP
ncbi:protein-L-isoaspartate O-methyltransferase family protein, partial [Escherichia coli]|uniref:protein-L-isoaspartate O-methyltransferase family protein n=1 Tax=Escherichia coli TaxID=562 RepID=UPI0025A58E6A